MKYIAISLLTACFLLLSACKSEEQRQAEIEEERQEIEEMNQRFWNDSLTNAASDIADLARMDSTILRFMRKNELKGVSLAVMRNDSLLYAKGYGFADEEGKQPMQPTSIMRVASVSKLITAVGIMKLVDEGRIKLQHRVFGPKGIIRDLEITGGITDERIYDITVRQLLQHRAGFTTPKGDPMFNTADLIKSSHLDHVPSPKEVAGIVLSRKLGYTPGERSSYSNFGYMVLSLVIEKVTGKSYWDYMQEDVLKPAGITSFQAAGNYLADRHEREVRYYNTDLDTIREYTGSNKLVTRRYGGNNVNGLLGGGAWVASAPGLARLVASIDSIPGVPDILTLNSVREMTRYNEEPPVSFGWSSVPEPGKWQRTGTLASTQAMICKYPDGECWVMVSNTGHWTGYKFNAEYGKLFDQLREKYSPAFPKRDLFQKQTYLPM